MIELNNVNFSYGKNKVLCGITASVGKGLTVILGPNGCGKSTLLGIMAGLYKSDGCTLDGRDVCKISPQKRAKKLAYVSQNGYIASDITVLDAVMLGRYCHVGVLGSYSDKDKQAAENALKICGAVNLKDRSVLDLSGGELQRVLLARALAQLGDTGSVLLLDEPITGLDIYHQHQFLSTVKQISKEKCVVAVLHDAALAARYADRVMVISNGNLYAQGRPEDVLLKRTFADVWGINGAVKMGENGYYLDIIT